MARHQFKSTVTNAKRNGKRGRFRVVYDICCSICHLIKWNFLNVLHEDSWLRYNFPVSSLISHILIQHRTNSNVSKYDHLEIAVSLLIAVTLAWYFRDITSKTVYKGDGVSLWWIFEGGLFLKQALSKPDDSDANLCQNWRLRRCKQHHLFQLKVLTYAGYWCEKLEYMTCLWSFEVWYCKQKVPKQISIPLVNPSIYKLDGS